MIFSSNFKVHVAAAWNQDLRVSPSADDPLTSPSTTLLIEGMNNKIKVVERIGHVYRGDGHFPLEIRATLPGILG